MALESVTNITLATTEHGFLMVASDDRVREDYTNHNFTVPYPTNHRTKPLGGRQMIYWMKPNFRNPVAVLH